MTTVEGPDFFGNSSPLSAFKPLQAMDSALFEREYGRWFLVVHLAPGSDRAGQSLTVSDPGGTHAGTVIRVFALKRRQEGMFDYVSIGRHPDNDVHIPDPTVSRFHCFVRLDDDGVRLQDAGSSGGTFVDNQPVAVRRKGPPTLVKDGAAVRIGGVEAALASASSLQALL